MREVLLLCWRDTGHPQGGGSERYLEQVGAELAARGIKVTLRTAALPRRRRAPRPSTASRSAAAAAATPSTRARSPRSSPGGSGSDRCAAPPGRGDRHPERHPVLRPRPSPGPGHGARASLPPRAVAGRGSHRRAHRLVGGVACSRRVRTGATSTSRSRCRRRRISPPSASTAAGSRWCATAPTGPGHRRDRRREHPHHVSEHVRAVPAGAAQADRGRPRRRREPARRGRRVCVSTLSAADGGTTTSATAPTTSASPTRSPSTGTSTSDASIELLARSWVHVLPSRKEGWGLAVIEAAQHGVPTVGYRSSRGLTDSIIDGVTGVLVGSDQRDGDVGD